MSWWKTALYDTCSLLTLDKLLLESPGLSRQFTKNALALDESFAPQQMSEETAERLRQQVVLRPLPSQADVARLLSSVRLSDALSDHDKLIFATAAHSKLAVVTSDRRLARAIQRKKLAVGNMALVLKNLVELRKLGKRACEKLMQNLANRQDYLLRIPNPTWNDLKSYTFPA